MESDTNGVHKAALDLDTLTYILELTVGLQLKPSELVPLFSVCKSFRETMEKLVYKSISLNENRDSYPDYCSISFRTRKNGVTYGLFCRTLESRPDLAARIESLSILTLYADQNLVDVQYKIMDLCPSITVLYLSLLGCYEKDTLKRLLAKINPLAISFCGKAYERPSSRWGMSEVFYVTQDCNKLLHLFVRPDRSRSSFLENIPDNIVLPSLRTLSTGDSWSSAELICLENVSFPKIKTFHGAIRSRSRVVTDVFCRSLTEKWSTRLTELVLSVHRTFHNGTNHHIENIDNAIKSLPKLRKLSITAELLSPQSLLSMKSLKEVCYQYAELSDLEVLARSLRETLHGPNVSLPILQLFELKDCTQKPGVGALITCIFVVLKMRGIKRGLRPASLVAKLDVKRVEYVMCDISNMYAMEADVV